MMKTQSKIDFTRGCQDSGSSERIISAIPDQKFEATTAILVEAGEIRNDGTIIARCLAKASNSVPVRVANVNHNTVTLKKGDVIGICEPVLKITRCDRELESTQMQIDFPEEILKKFNSSWSHLSEPEKQMTMKFFKEKAGIFVSGKITGRTNLVQHKINIGDVRPI